MLARVFHARFLAARGCLMVISLICALLPAPAAASEVPCEYIADILSVSLPDQAGQPAEIDFTSSSLLTYQQNLGFASDFAAAYASRRVLDVGGGLSEFVDVLADSFGVEALAIDLAYAELNLEGLSPECVDLFYRRRIAMDAQHLLFPSNFFDLVVSHSLLKWFFLSEPEVGYSARLRIQRGMDMVSQMVRVVDAEGEVRTTDFPDPHGDWYAEHRPELVNTYRAAYREFLRPYLNGGELSLDITFHYQGSRGYTRIRKLARIPRVDAQGTVSVIRAPRRRPPTHPHR